MQVVTIELKFNHNQVIEEQEVLDVLKDIVNKKRRLKYTVDAPLGVLLNQYEQSKKLKEL